MTLSALFAALLAITSLVAIPIPFSPVPITLQVLTVFLIAALLGPRYGAISCLIYLVFGSVGLPVFAGGASGPAILFGPTGGYLLGFPIGAFAGGLVCGKISVTKKLDLIRIGLGVTVALAAIYFVGVFWLSEFLGISLTQAVLIGALPFIIVDTAKAIIAIPIALRLRSARLNLPVQRHSNEGETLETSSKRQVTTNESK